MKELLVALSDSMMVWGPASLGMNTAQVLSYSQLAYGEDLARNAEHYRSLPYREVGGEKIYQVERQDIAHGHSPQQVIAALAYLNDFRRINVLILTPPVGIMFTGNPILARSLYQQFGHDETQFRDNYFGGNAQISSYWGLSDIRGGHETFDKLYQKVMGILGLPLVLPKWDILPIPLMIPKKACWPIFESVRQ
ncbi:MAG: hypothetical protein WCG27_10950, partial [Pseudomonadota bacterium]